jgi:hypothetical protein
LRDAYPTGFCRLSPVQDQDSDDEEEKEPGADGDTDHHRLWELSLATYKIKMFLIMFQFLICLSIILTRIIII